MSNFNFAEIVVKRSEMLINVGKYEVHTITSKDKQFRALIKKQIRRWIRRHFRKTVLRQMLNAIIHSSGICYSQFSNCHTVFMAQSEHTPDNAT